MNLADRMVALALTGVMGVAAAQQPAPSASSPNVSAGTGASTPNATLAAASTPASTPNPNPNPNPTPTPTPTPTSAQASTPSSTSAPRATAQSEAGEPRADTSVASAKGVASSPQAAAPRTGVSTRAVPPGSKKTADAADRLDLGTATVTGDREQPKVMYIVPWKRSEMGDLAGKPMNSLVDEILAPVDRDVFKREVIYYKAVQTDAAQNSAQPAPQGEK